MQLVREHPAAGRVIVARTPKSTTLTKRKG